LNAAGFGLRTNDAVGHSTPQQLLEDALAAYRKGRVGDAKRLYAAVLKIDPTNAAAHGNLAIIAAQQGDLTGAERLVRREIELRPDYPASHNNLGSVLQQQGRPADAVAAHRQAIKLNPNYAEAFLALGNALRQQGHLDEAMAAYRSAIEARRDYAEAHNNIGVLLQMQGCPAQAASAYREALALRPGYGEAEFNLGGVLHQQQELKAAEASYRRVISLNPGIAVVHNNLGTVLKDQGLLDAALAAFENAVQLQPDYAEAIYNRATVLQQQSKLEAALADYGRAIELRNDHADAINNAGIVLQELGRASEAVDLYRALLARMPDHADACNNLGTALLAEGRPEEARAAFEQALTHRPDFPEAFYNLGNAWRELGNLTEAIAAYRNALRLRPDYADAFSQLGYHRAQACAWDDDDADQEKLLGMVRQGVRSPPFYLLSTPASARDQLVCARQWIEPIRPPADAVFPHQLSAGRGRIRLGYLSGDFHQHATAALMAELFERHDRDRFEVFAYSYGPDDNSPMRARLARGFDRFADIRALSHREAAGRIHADQVDILIDLKGYTHHARPAISAHRPAPVQVSYLGYPATMGADFIDYIIVDPFVVPASQQPFFSERLVHLPCSYQVNDRQRAVAAGRSRQDYGLPADGFVFCCFNNTYKLSPAVFDIWMRLLGSVPGSVLWLLEANQLVEGNLRSEAGKRGVDAARLIFAPVVPSAEHLGRHGHADLFLDTLPCNAHTTASDALWVGLPILTCSGETFAGRVAGSLLTAVGMPELITTSLEQYERTALALARDPQRLVALRQTLQKSRDASALFDLPKLTANIEAAYGRMWQTWLSGERPAAFSIETAESNQGEQPC
jgi:predicted O-linked N-acetylglucosamine transferase (SPINDLY family)